MILLLQLAQLTDDVLLVLQESTIGAAFLTKTMPEQNVKFEIWYVNYSLGTNLQHMYRGLLGQELQYDTECSFTAGILQGKKDITA